MIGEEGDYTKVRQKHQIKRNITPLKSSIQRHSKVELKLRCSMFFKWVKMSEQCTVFKYTSGKNEESFLSGVWIQVWINSIIT